MFVCAVQMNATNQTNQTKATHLNKILSLKNVNAATFISEATKLYGRHLNNELIVSKTECAKIAAHSRLTIRTVDDALAIAGFAGT